MCFSAFQAQRTTPSDFLLAAETRLSTMAPVYSHRRAGPVARAERGVRTALADLHLYSHHWEVLARVSYKYALCSFIHRHCNVAVSFYSASARPARMRRFGDAASVVD